MGSRTHNNNHNNNNNNNNNNKAVTEMPSYVPQLSTSNPIGTEANSIHPSRVSDFATFEQSLGFRIDDAVDLSRTQEALDCHLRSSIWAYSQSVSC